MDNASRALPARQTARHEHYRRTRNGRSRLRRSVSNVVRTARRREFLRRTLWLAFLKAGGRVAPILIPIEDLPHEPAPHFDDGLRAIVGELVGRDGVESAALLLARPGSSALTREDRAWARMLTDVSPRWPISLGTVGSVRIFEPDDLTG